MHYATHISRYQGVDLVAVCQTREQAAELREAQEPNVDTATIVPCTCDDPRSTHCTTIAGFTSTPDEGDGGFAGGILGLIDRKGRLYADDGQWLLPEDER